MTCNSIRQIGILLVGVSVLLLAEPVAAGDWGMLQCNQQRTGYTTEMLDSVLRLERVIDLGHPQNWSFANPVVAGDTAYLCCVGDTLFAVDIGTGQTVWRFSIGMYDVATPCVSGGSMYVPVADLSATYGAVFKLNRMTGDTIWSHRFNYGITELVVGNGLVYVGYPGVYDVMALDTTDGDTVWSYIAPSTYLTHAALSPDGSRLLVSDASGLVHCVNALTGAQMWTYNSGGSWGQKHSAVVDTVVYGIYGGFAGCWAFAVRLSNGGQMWRTSLAVGNAPNVTFAVDSQRLYCSTADSVYALDRVTGAVVWRRFYQRPPSTDDSVSAGPIVAGNTVYFTFVDSLVGLDRQTGSAVLTKCVGRLNNHCFPSVADGRLCVQNALGQLLVFGSSVTPRNTRGWKLYNCNQVNTRYYPYPTERRLMNEPFTVRSVWQHGGTVNGGISADVNNDGYLEVACHQGTHLRLHAWNGTLLWDQNLGDSIRNVVLDDVTGDSLAEVIACVRSSATTSSILCYDGSGYLVRLMPMTTNSDEGWVRGAEDIDRDGVLDMVAVGGNRHRGLYVYDCDRCTEKWHFDIGPQTDPNMVIADINGDSRTEIVIGTAAFHNGVSANGYDDFHTWIIAFNDSGRVIWDRQLGSWLLDPAFADLDGDDTAELFVSRCQDIYGGYAGVFILNPTDGTVRDSFLGEMNEYCRVPAIADIDGDAQNEAALAFHSSHRLRVFNGALGVEDSVSLGGDYFVLAINDVNGDSLPEIVVGSTFGPVLRVLRQDLTELWSRTFSADIADAGVCDLEADGKNEIVVATADSVYVLGGRFAPQNAVPGWRSAAPMPAAPSGRLVKAGGWLVYDAATSLVYATKGNKTSDFYSYDPLADVWTSRAAIPDGSEAKKPGRGAAACADGGGHVYCTKGNNTQGFYRYAAAADSWIQLADVPLGTTNKKVKGGTDMVFVPGRGGAPDYLYLLKGHKNEFWRYDPDRDSWSALAPAPAEKWDKGSWLACDDSNTVFAHQAKIHGFYPYDLRTQTWQTPLTGMPLMGRSGRPKKSKDGGAGVWFDGRVFALKGGNTQEFWRYDAVRDSWQELDTMPRVAPGGTKKKKVKTGADITTIPLALRDRPLVPVDLPALKGNGTGELWIYRTDALAGREFGDGALGRTGGVTPRVFVAPNPPQAGLAMLSYNLPRAGAIGVRVFDVTGRAAVTRFAMAGRTGRLSLDLRQLSAGVYLLRLDADGYSTQKKLVIQR